jgi:hypothetical protein
METSELRGINLSAIGGVDTGVILEMAHGRIAVLTSARESAALLLPWPWSAMIANDAAENCRTMQNTQRYGGLKTEVLASLNDGEFRAVWLRAAEPVAVLSRYPQGEAERENIAQRYLALLESV